MGVFVLIILACSTTLLISTRLIRQGLGEPLLHGFFVRPIQLDFGIVRGRNPAHRNEVMLAALVLYDCCLPYGQQWQTACLQNK